VTRKNYPLNSTNEESSGGFWNIFHQPGAMRRDRFALQVSCIDPYQLQGAQGSFYFRIINESGSPTAQQYGRRIAAFSKKNCANNRQPLRHFSTGKNFNGIWPLCDLFPARWVCRTGFPIWRTHLKG